MFYKSIKLLKLEFIGKKFGGYRHHVQKNWKKPDNNSREKTFSNFKDKLIEIIDRIERMKQKKIFKILKNVGRNYINVN